MSNESTASFLDKTDWRVTLHRKLEACVDAEGTEYYNQRVKSLISCVSAQFPGWDAEKEINIYISKREKYYTNLHDIWFEDNSTRDMWDKYFYKKALKTMLHHDIFNYIKNMCARKRMLLWGSKSIGGGTQMAYTGD